MTAITKLQFSPFHANFCRGLAKPLICPLHIILWSLRPWIEKTTNRFADVGTVPWRTFQACGTILDCWQVVQDQFDHAKFVHGTSVQATFIHATFVHATFVQVQYFSMQHLSRYNICHATSPEILDILSVTYIYGHGEICPRNICLADNMKGPKYPAMHHLEMNDDLSEY